MNLPFTLFRLGLLICFGHLAVGTDAEGPAIMISADNCGLLHHVRETLLKRLEKKGITSDKLAICVSHSHSSPKLAGNLNNMFGKDIPPEQQAHIDRYTRVRQDVPFTACVRSTGLMHNGDEVHFDGKSQRELGKRYATEMLKLQRAMNQTK
jgi:hypothetical protein